MVLRKRIEIVVANGAWAKRLIDVRFPSTERNDGAGRTVGAARHKNTCSGKKVLATGEERVRARARAPETEVHSLSRETWTLSRCFDIRQKTQ